MTTELRKELEHQYDLATRIASDKAPKTPTNQAKSNYSEVKDKSTNKVCDSDDSLEYLEAPRSYKKEYAELFKSLPPAMRKYLYERESETEKGFSRINNELNNRRWIDDIFNSRASRLERLGITKAQDWIKLLAAIDDAFEENPLQALQNLAEVYGVKEQFVITPQAFANFKNDPKVKADALPDKSQFAKADSSTLSAIQKLESKFNELTALFEAHLADNKAVMESKKAHEASFAPKGKNFDKDLSKLSTREVLELQLADYN